MNSYRMTLPGLLRAALMSCLLSVVPLALGIDTTELADPALQARYQGLTHELRCMQCQNQSIADSPVGLASDLRREVKELLVAGKSDDEVREWMKERYGAFILFRPEYTWRNAWLWLAPLVLLLVGAMVAWRVVRKRAVLVATDSSDVDSDASADRSQR